MYRSAVIPAAVFSLSLGLARPLPAADPAPPPVPREFRGAWVATVSNIDWPSKPGLPTETQKAELLAILDRAAALNLNAVVFQVRPMCDALYPSKLEPWSAFLTGRTGAPPAPAWDPLAFAVTEAHRRGLELHAWLNPYRARVPGVKADDLPADHLVKRRPELAKAYGKHHWLNPTHPDVQAHSLAVFLDVVRRYDVDGVHLDDYFYPYPEAGPDGKPIPFPDDDTWAAYRDGGGKLARDDWRRDAVNRFVERLYREVKAAKPWVLVGVSPFGIWRPGHPPGIAGLDQYAALYADAKLWLNNGWVDYWSPQLYWPIAQEKQSFPKLLGWWAGENAKGRHLWPGLYTSRVTGGPKGWPAAEVADQIAATRKLVDPPGHVHFSMKALAKNTGGVADAVAKAYADKALVPASPWLGDKPPGKPELAWAKPGELRATAAAGEPARWFLVRSHAGGGWRTDLRPAADPIPVPKGVDVVSVSAVSRTGVTGEPATIRP